MPYAPPLFKHLADSALIIDRVLELPCADPITVLVQATTAVIGGMIWGYITPDPKEVYHQAVGEPLVHSIRAGFDDAFEAQGSGFGKSRRFIGKFLGAADRIVWWQFLAASAEQGLIQAQGAMRRLARCDNFHDPNFGSGGWYVSAINDKGDWQGIDIAIDQPGSKFYPVAGSGIIAKANRTAMVSASAQFSDFNDVPVGTNARVIRTDTGAYLDYDSNGVGEDITETSTHTWYKSKSQFAGDTVIQNQFSYDGPPLPLHEAFPIASTVNGYLYD